MTIEQPVQATAADLLLTARDLAGSDDESAAPDAYRAAIHAVEQAFRDIATPDNPTDDLGVILAHWQDRPDLWSEGYSRVYIIEPTMAALASLWEHRPQPDDWRPASLIDAKVAVTLAEAATNLIAQGQIELLDELTPEEEAADRALAEQRWNEYESGQMETIPLEDYLRDRAARDGDT